jgi:voltage-gated potassium channel
MNSSLKRILTGVIFFVITLVAAVIGYMLAGWSLLDAIYMVVITVFGVGYGEVKPITTPLLRIFTMLVIIAGTSSAVYAVSGFLQLITEGEIKKAIGARRMIREIETLKQHVIICGYGRMGQILARRLAEAQQPFVIIDNDSDRAAKAEALGYLVQFGSATDEAILELAGITRAKTLATVLPDDAANVFITLTARSLHPDLIILARGEYPSTERKLKQAGADQVVSPAAIGALRMAHLITHPAALNFLEQGDGLPNLNELLARIDVQIDELAIPPRSDLVGASIGTVEVRGQGAFIIVALRRLDGTTIIHPGRELFLHEGDTLVVMGHRGDIPQFARLHALKRQMRYRGATF